MSKRGRIRDDIKTNTAKFEGFVVYRAILLAVAILPLVTCAAEVPQPTAAITHPDINAPDQPSIDVSLRSVLNREHRIGQLVPASVRSIISPVSATIEAGGPGFGNIDDTLNQNGLTSHFTSGVTNFDTYMATAPLHTMVYPGFEWFSNEESRGAIVTYDLGTAITIDRLALWNEESAGIGTLDLLVSTDGVEFTALASGLHPTDNADTTPLDRPPYAANVFAFAPTRTRFVRFVASDSPQPLGPGCCTDAAIGEVAFRVGSSADLIARTVAWNAGGDGVDLTYEVTEDLLDDATVSLFWTRGPSQDDLISWAFSQAVDRPAGTHVIHVPASQLAEPLEDPAYLLMVLDSEDTIDNIAEDPSNNEADLRLPSLEVKDPANTTEFRITPEPAMPSITLGLRDVPANLVPSISASWHTEITSQRHDFAHQIATFNGTPIDVTVTGSDRYQPNFGSQIVGGKLTSVVQYTIAGVPLRLSSEVLHLQVLGTQPDAAAIEASIRMKAVPLGFPAEGGFGYHDVLLRIMRQESFGGLQFFENGSPVFNTANDGGAGLFQITPPNIAQVWNWQANEDGGADVFNGKLAEAIAWIDNRAVQRAVQQVRQQFSLPDSTPVQVAEPPWPRDVMVLREAVQRYNGGNAFQALGQRVILPDGTTIIEAAWERVGNGYHEVVLGALMP